MFYAHFELSRRAPLAKIWLAAHWDKKLSKSNIFDINIESSVDNILNPAAKMALRTSGHLMLGVVRVHNRKARYLLADCNEAFIKIKMAFRPGMANAAGNAGLDLPDGAHELATITLPEVFRDFDTSLTDFADFAPQAVGAGGSLRLNQSRLDEITMKEDVPSHTTLNSFSDGFGPSTSDIELMRERDRSRDRSMVGMIDSFGGMERPYTAFGDDFSVRDPLQDSILSAPLGPEVSLFEEEPLQNPMSVATIHPDMLDEPEEPVIQNETTLMKTTLTNETDGFVLKPLQSAASVRKRRKLIVDEHIKITAAVMKAQMEDTSDIVTTLDLAPPTKKLMQWKDTGCVERMFSLPGRICGSSTLLERYVSNLRSDLPKEFQEELPIDPPAVEEPEPMEVQREDTSAVMQFVEPPTPAAPYNVSLNMDPPTPYIDQPSHTAAPPPTPLIDMGGPPEDDLFGNVDSPDDSCPGFDDPPSPQSPIEEDIFGITNQSSPEDGEGVEEDRRWNKRTRRLATMLSRSLDEATAVSFSALSKGVNRKQASAMFYTLLVLKKHAAVEIVQDLSYGPIIISKGAQFSSLE